MDAKHYYYNKRRRYRSSSPSRERPKRKVFTDCHSKEDEMDTVNQIKILRMKVDLLTAQLALIRKELHERDQRSQRDKETQCRLCIFM